MLPVRGNQQPAALALQLPPEGCTGRQLQPQPRQAPPRASWSIRETQQLPHQQQVPRAQQEYLQQPWQTAIPQQHGQPWQQPQPQYQTLQHHTPQHRAPPAGQPRYARGQEEEETEAEMFRRLEDEILMSVNAADAGAGPGDPGSVGPRVGRKMAVAASDTESQFGRKHEDDILAVAGSCHSETAALGRLTQASPGAKAAAVAESKSRSAPGCMLRGSVMTREDEEAMDLIMGLV